MTHVLVHVASPDGVPRPYLLPTNRLVVSVASSRQGQVLLGREWVVTLERASVIVRAIQSRSEPPGSDAAAVVRAFEAIEARLAEMEEVRAEAEKAPAPPGPPGVPWGPPTSPPGGEP